MNRESVLNVCKGIIAEAQRKEKLLKQYQEEQSYWAFEDPNIAPVYGNALLLDLEAQLAACYKQERVNLKRLRSAVTRALKHYNSKNVTTTEFKW